MMILIMLSSREANLSQGMQVQFQSNSDYTASYVLGHNVLKKIAQSQPTVCVQYDTNSPATHYGGPGFKFCPPETGYHV